MAAVQTIPAPRLDFHERFHTMSEQAQAVQPQRQPSQQDLEIARQLQHFHSQQSLPIQDDDRQDSHMADTHPADAELPVRSGPYDDARPLPQPQQAGSIAGSDQNDSRQISPNPALTGQVCTNCGTTKTPLWRRSPAGAVICNACGLYYKARNQMRPVGLKRSAAAMTTSSPSLAISQTQERSTSPTPLQSGASYVSTDQIADGTCPGGGRCNSQGGKLICQGCPSFNNRIAKAAQVALRQAGDRGHGTSTPSTQETQQTVVVACQNCGTTVTPLWRRDEAGNAICNACGLYHKLHGHHRPVQMKRAEIKRRKRVVPAPVNQDPALTAYSEQLSDRTSTSPGLSTQHITTLEPRTGPSPIPVDFTDAFRSTHPNDASVPSKRAYTTNPESEPYPHAQNMGFSAINAIDPSLPTSDATAGMSKEARRALLRREAEKMRQQLEEKERELAALADDD